MKIEKVGRFIRCDDHAVQIAMIAGVRVENSSLMIREHGNAPTVITFETQAQARQAMTALLTALEKADG